MNIENIDVIKSNRRTLALEIKKDGRILVRAPRFATKREIEKFVQEHSDWIEKHLAKVQKEIEIASEDRLSIEEVKALAEEATRLIPERVKIYAEKLGVTYGRITIRNQVTRWGSCTRNGNLNFNCLLMLMPLEVLDSVVVHELCHRVEMNHSKRFYDLVLSVYPDYKKWDKWLKENGGTIMRRMTG